MELHSPQLDSLKSPTTVLLVEDNAQVRKWLHSRLERHGYNLLEACDGVDAMVIAELHHGPIHILVTDVVMPRMDGPTLVKTLLPLRPDVRVLYISGFPAPILERQASLGPEAGYLQKPFRTAQLLERIEALLQAAIPKADSWMDRSREPETIK
jgi:two-component system, cell cycle sensor histidine kinase and response regulator CckA